MRIAFEVIVAALAVFGLYFLYKVISGWIFAPECIFSAVIIEQKTQLKDLELFLQNASSALFRVRRRQIAVLIPKEILQNLRACEIVTVLDTVRQFGAKLIIIKKEVAHERGKQKSPR